MSSSVLKKKKKVYSNIYQNYCNEQIFQTLFHCMINL